MVKNKGLLSIVLCTALVLPMQASGYYKTKKVQYTGMNIYYNGTPKALSAQPVVIDGTTYLPVRALCDATGLGIDWSGNALYITNGTSYNGYSTQAELQAKEAQIASLTKELQNLKNQMGIVTTTTSSGSSSSSSSTGSYTRTSGSDITGSELSATEKALRSEYGSYFDDIDFDFDLTVSSGKLRVYIDYDRSYENTKFNNLSTTKIKNFIRDVCEEIRRRHDDIAITGKIRYGSSTKYSFDYSRGDSLSTSAGYAFDDDDDDITDRDIERIVERNNIRIDDYGKVSIYKAEADVDDKDETVVFDVYLDLSDSSALQEAWNKYTGTNNNSELRDSMRSIAKEIARETGYRSSGITGRIYDRNGSRIGRYDYDDNELTTSKYDK